MTSRNLSTKRGSLDSLNWRIRCGCRPWARQMRWTELTLSPAAFAIKAPVQWVVSPGGSPSVKATTRSVASAVSGLIREGRVLSRSRPSNPSSIMRSCQRQTQVLDLAVRRMISFVPTPSAGQQHDCSSPDVLLRRVAVLNLGFEPTNVDGRNGEQFSCAHRADSHVRPASGIYPGLKCQVRST